MGWNKDLVPARSAREALTAWKSESKKIHYGKTLDRQQALCSIENNVLHVERSGEVASTVTVDTREDTIASAFHANSFWMGQNAGAFIICTEAHKFNRKLWRTATISALLSVLLIMAFVSLDAYLFTGATISRCPWQVWVYAAVQAALVATIHLSSTINLWIHLPPRAPLAGEEEICEQCTCQIHYIRVFHQRLSTTGTPQRVAYLYCQRAYQAFQGARHPSFASISDEKTSQAKVSLFKKPILGKVDRYVGLCDSICYLLSIILSASSLVTFPIFVGWMTENVRQGNSARIYGCTAIEGLLSALKVVTLSNIPRMYTLRSGATLEKNLQVKAGSGTLSIKGSDFLEGRIYEVKEEHIFFETARMRYKDYRAVATLHISLSSNHVVSAPPVLLHTTSEGATWLTLSAVVEAQENPSGRRTKCLIHIPIKRDEEGDSGVAKKKRTFGVHLRSMEPVASTSAQDDSKSIERVAKKDTRNDTKKKTKKGTRKDKKKDTKNDTKNGRERDTKKDKKKDTEKNTEKDSKNGLDTDSKMDIWFGCFIESDTDRIIKSNLDDVLSPPMGTQEVLSGGVRERAFTLNPKPFGDDEEAWVTSSADFWNEDGTSTFNRWFKLAKQEVKASKSMWPPFPCHLSSCDISFRRSDGFDAVITQQRVSKRTIEEGGICDCFKG